MRGDHLDMGVLRRFTDEDPVPVTARSRLPASAVCAAIGAALAAGHLASVPGGEQLIYRLEGTVTGSAVSLRVSTSATHVGTLPLWSITGEVHDTDTGSEFRGGMVVASAASATWLLVIGADVVIGVLLLAVNSPLVLALWALGFAFVLAGPTIRRRTLRGPARDIGAILAAIADTEVTN